MQKVWDVCEEVGVGVGPVYNVRDVYVNGVRDPCMWRICNVHVLDKIFFLIGYARTSKSTLVVSII